MGAAEDVCEPLPFSDPHFHHSTTIFFSSAAAMSPTDTFIHSSAEMETFPLFFRTIIRIATFHDFFYPKTFLRNIFWNVPDQSLFWQECSFPHRSARTLWKHNPRVKNEISFFPDQNERKGSNCKRTIDWGLVKINVSFFFLLFDS